MAAERFEEVREKMRAFMAEWPDSEFGPAHIILSDHNLEDEWIDMIIGNIERRDFGSRYEPGDELPSDEELKTTIVFLRTLKEIPEDERCPDDGFYDDEECDHEPGTQAEA